MIKKRKPTLIARKSIVIFLISLCFMGNVFVEKAHAQFAVAEIGLNLFENTSTALNTILSHIKSYVLDPLAWVLSKSTLQSIVKSTISSVNKNGSGSPAYVTNLSSLLKSTGDTQANGFISQLQTNGSIKSPFQTAVATYTKNNYLQSTSNTGFFTQNAFTLGKVSPNPTMAYNGGIFTQQGGGFNAWMNAWGYQANNPYGASMLASEALGSQVASAQNQVVTEAGWGQGYLSQRPASSVTTTGGTSAKTTASNPLSLSGIATDLTKSIQTPGSTIKASLEKATGSGIDTLVNAHTFNEIITSLLGQLINQIVSPGGLSGTTQPASSGSTYFNQTDPSQAAINNNLTTSFTSTISDQITQVLQYQTSWTTINTAALTANTALSSSTCYPNAQGVIANIVQPVLSQASAALAKASAAIVALKKVQAELPPAISTANQATAISQVSTDYSNLVQGSTLPSATDISFAQAQSADNSTSTTTPPKLYTQMTQLTVAAQKCHP